MGQTQIAPTESDLTASYLSERGLPSPSLKWLLVATILVTACLGPTFISYQPIILRWDDADYLMRAVAASRAFWSGDVHRLGAAMVSVHTPIMTFLGLPWGSLASWDSAGKCFLSLAAVIALLAALCVYMLLRIGVKPIFLVAAAICVGVSLGPYPAGEHAATIDVHALATGFYTDNLLAWLVLAAVLLIPFEARTSCLSVSSAVVRGVLCASIFSLGATKVSFFYFIVIIAPLLLFMRFRYGGIRSALAWLIALVCFSAPTAIFFLRYGRTALANARAASFGGVAGFYHIPQ